MFVDVTENGELKKKVQSICKKHQVKVKVVEKMNRTIKNTLQRSNPYDWKHCGRNDCPTCNLGIPINCRERGVCYEIDCKNCRITVMKLYRGQTERSTYERKNISINGKRKWTTRTYTSTHWSATMEKSSRWTCVSLHNATESRQQDL